MNTAISQDINRAVIADRSSTIRRALAGRSIVLVGIMGVGKSTIGKRMAQYLDIPFVDADKEIEKAAGMSIEDIFDQFGEDAFRSGEKKVIKRLMGEGQKILATGGGAFMNEEIREDIKEGGVSVWLDADLEILMKRVQRRSDRPLLKEDDPEAVMKWQTKMDNAVGKAEVLIQKQRHGPIGSVMLSFTPELTKFGNLAPDEAGGYGGY